MATRTLTHETRVPGRSPEQVIDWLADLGHTVGLQPLIESAALVGTQVVDGLTTTHWRIAERPRLGRWGYRIRFGATVTRLEPTRLRTRVRAAAGTRLQADVTATADAGGADTLVVQQLTVSAPALTIGYVLAQARAAHTEAFRRLPGLLAP